MSVTRHWRATSPAYSTDLRDARVMTTEADAELYRASGWWVEGPFVPDTTQGAVGAFEALAVAKELTERHLLAYDHADTVLEQINAALDLLGGQ